MSYKLNLAVALFAASFACGGPVDDPSSFEVDEQDLSPAGSYIVVFQDGVDFKPYRARYAADARIEAEGSALRYLDRGVVGMVQELARGHAFEATHFYSAALRGFAARMTEDQARALAADKRIAYIEPDQEMYAIAQTLPWGIDRVDADISSTLAGNGSGSVSGVNAYVIDTGIDTGHADLNVVGHVNFAGGQNRDCHGHGTHVAGTVAARDDSNDVVGVAPGARLTGVKVLSCSGSGSNAGVINGVDWVTANAARPATANMSLGGGVSNALDTAVRNSADSGVFYALAAGNSGVDACTSSPARAGTHNGVATVAATDSNNNEASWSNYGNCVDIWAPGVSVLSTRRGGGTTTFSGTSMASPHVAGSGTLYLSGNSGASAAQVESALKSTDVCVNRNSKDGRQICIVNVASY
jgi:subtilisin family serine protease